MVNAISGLNTQGLHLVILPSELSLIARTRSKRTEVCRQPRGPIRPDITGTIERGGYGSVPVSNAPQGGAGEPKD